MSKYAYGRVSSKDQNLNRQLDAFKQKNIERKNIYMDKQSGKNFERTQYKKMVKKLKSGDELFVLSISRLGRNYEETLEQWRFLTKEKQVELIVMDMPLLDTRYAKDLLGTFITDLVLNIFSYAAEQQRQDIRDAQAAGIKSAKNRGVKFGRPKTLDEEKFRKEYKAYKEAGFTNEEIIKKMNISLSTFYRYKKMNKK